MAGSNSDKKAADKAAAKKSAEGKAGTPNALRVTCKREGFRRAGRVWGKEPVVILFADLSSEQLEQIMGEPMLDAVEVVSEEAAA